MKTKPQDVPYCGIDAEKLEAAEPLLNLESWALACRWIKERYSVHLKKDVEKLPGPWTDWAILQKFRFTNVKRELDKETIYVLKTVLLNDSLTMREKVLNTIMFRFWNKHETFEAFGFPKKEREFTPEDFSQAEQDILEFEKTHPKYTWYTNAFLTVGIKRVWANAEMKWGANDPKDKVMPRRPLYLWNWLLQNGIVDKILSSQDQMEVINNLWYDSSTKKGVPGIGEFLSYQIFLDLSYIPEYPFSENEMTIAGPGCKLGLKYLFKDRAGLKWEELLFWLRNNQEALLEMNGINCKTLMTDLPEEERFMSLANFENLMCEFSKTYRAVYLGGKPKNGYKSPVSEALF